MKLFITLIFIVLSISTNYSMTAENSTFEKNVFTSKSIDEIPKSSNNVQQSKEEYILEQLENINKRLNNRKIIWITEGLILITLFVSLIVVVKRSHSKNKSKNIAIVRQIREMQQLISSKQKLSFDFLYDKKTELDDSEATNENKLLIKNSNLLYKNLEELMLKERLYLNPNLSKEEVIYRLNTDSRSLSNSIKVAINGGTFLDYLASLRISESIFLLENYPEMTIEEIAEKTGFGNRKAFYRQFKKKFDISPSEYRELTS